LLVAAPLASILRARHISCRFKQLAISFSTAPLFVKNHLWERLITNISIVFFLAFHLRFLKNSKIAKGNFFFKSSSPRIYDCSETAMQLPVNIEGVLFFLPLAVKSCGVVGIFIMPE